MLFVVSSKNPKRKGNESMSLELLGKIEALAEELRQSQIAQKRIAHWGKRNLEDIQDSDTRLGVISLDLQKIIVGAKERYELLESIEDPSEKEKEEMLVLEGLSSIFGSLLKYEIPEARDFKDSPLLTLRKGFVAVGIKKRAPLVGRIIIVE